MLTPSSPDRWRRIRAIEAEWGKEEGWYVEWRGEIVGELSDGRWFDHFLDLYIFTPSTEDPDVLRALEDPITWNREQFRCWTRRTRVPASFGYPCGIHDDGRIIVRSLYVSPDLSWLEELVFRVRWLRRKLRAAHSFLTR